MCDVIFIPEDSITGTGGGFTRALRKPVYFVRNPVLGGQFIKAQDFEHPLTPRGWLQSANFSTFNLFLSSFPWYPYLLQVEVRVHARLSNEPTNAPPTETPPTAPAVINPATAPATSPPAPSPCWDWGSPCSVEKEYDELQQSIVSVARSPQVASTHPAHASHASHASQSTHATHTWIYADTGS